MARVSACDMPLPAGEEKRVRVMRASTRPLAPLDKTAMGSFWLGECLPAGVKPTIAFGRTMFQPQFLLDDVSFRRSSWG